MHRRHLSIVFFSIAILANLGSCQDQPETVSVSVESASIERIDRYRRDGTIVVSWQTTPHNSPVDVYIANSPQKDSSPMRLVSLQDTDGTHNIPQTEAGRRPYVYLTTGTEGLWAAPRFVAFEGPRNFRDLGGYETADGRYVKWGRIFRSDELSLMTPTDWDYFAELGIETIGDLRRSDEIALYPTALPSSFDVERITWPYSHYGKERRNEAEPLSPIARVETLNALSEEELDAYIESQFHRYHEAVNSRKAAYQELLERLASRDSGPLLVHCTAGKDRTGFAAALLLTALGVDEETVIDDYALTQSAEDLRPTNLEHMRPMLVISGVDKLSPPKFAKLIRTYRGAMETALKSIAREHGSVMSFIKTELNISDETINALRSNLLVSKDV